MNMFNSNGEMNASSLKDAAQQLMRYASILQDNMPSNTGLAGRPSMSDEQRDDLVSRAILTQDGKVALAQSMANPIK
jgi:hypothetical protein